MMTAQDFGSVTHDNQTVQRFTFFLYHYPRGILIMTTEPKAIDIETFAPAIGGHYTPEDGMCIMEAVSYIAGEDFTDHPKCACPVIASFLRSWNDSIQDDDRRRELMNPFLLRLAGTKSTSEVELERSWMAFDWLVRECAASFLELNESLKTHAQALRSLDELNAESIDTAMPIIKSAWAAARPAPWAAAWAAWAAGAADGDAAWAAGAAAAAAAKAAAWAAAWDAGDAGDAGDAAWAAAGDAAAAAADGAAAWAAAGDAAWAARDALKPTVEKLQNSASDLVDRMIKTGE